MSSSNTDESYTQYTAWLDRQPLATRSKQAYLWQVRRFLAWLPTHRDHEELLPDHTQPGATHRLSQANQVTAAVLDYKKHMLKANAAPATVNQALAALNNFYMSRGLAVSVDPIPQPKRAPKALTEADLRSLRRTAAGLNPRDRALVVVLLDTGLRLGELAALRTDDVAITARKGQLTVRVGKGGRPRRVPLTKECRQALQDWLTQRSTLRRRDTTPADALWISRLGKQMAHRTIGTVISRVGRTAGIDGLTPHKLRHTYISRLARGGADPFLVSEAAGHSRLETTLLYSRPNADEQDRVILDIIER